MSYIDELSFDYEVTAWVNLVEDNNITLEVKNFHTGKWEPKGIRNYTTPGENQPLRWESINLSCDNFEGIQGKYRFVGSYGSSSDIIGPIIEEKFYNLSVTPKEGTNNKTFTYSVTVNANISDKIALEVRNHSSGIWTLKGTKQNYTTPGVPDTLVWPNITLNDNELNPLNDARYRFVGFCNRFFPDEEGKESPFWETGLEWDNMSVEPERGLLEDEFTYCISMYAKRNLTVELVVYKPFKPPKEWLSEDIVYNETKEYTDIYNWTTICWNITPFENGNVGYSSYKFIFYRKNESINETTISKGPYVDIAKFENATVEPEIGTGKTILNYSVEVIATETGKVELFTKCPEGTTWKPQGHKLYTTPGIREPFKWTKIDLSCDNCGNAEYYFEFTPGLVPSKHYTSPKIIKEEFGEPFVSPEKGTDCTEFNFSVNFNGCIEENLTLQVWNSSSKIWEDVSTRHYIPPGIKPISFSNITCPESLVPQWSDERVIKWRVNGSIPNSNSSLASTYWDIELKWYNSSFSQEKGWWNDTFNFSVNLSANLNGSVELQIKLEGVKNNSWNPVGEKKRYNRPNPQILRWRNVSICNESYEGDTSYRFVFYWGDLPYLPNSFDPDHGPKLFKRINISFKDAFVEPNDGVCYTFKDYIINNGVKYYIFEEDNNTFFNFSVTLRADKNTTVKLILVDPDDKEYTINDKKGCEYVNIKPHQWSTCSWTQIELPSGQIGTWNYTFKYYDTRYDDWNRSERLFDGPNIIAVFENYTLDPKPPIPYGKVCNVIACMNGHDEMNVTLEAYNVDPYSSDYNNWTRIGTEHYEPSRKKCLRWSIDTFVVPFDKLRLKWEEK